MENNNKTIVSSVVIILIIVVGLIFVYSSKGNSKKEAEKKELETILAPLPEVSVSAEEKAQIDEEKAKILKMISSGKQLTDEEKETIRYAVSSQINQLKFNFSEEEKLSIIQALK